MSVQQVYSWRLHPVRFTKFVYLNCHWRQSWGPRVHYDYDFHLSLELLSGFPLQVLRLIIYWPQKMQVSRWQSLFWSSRDWTAILPYITLQNCLLIHDHTRNLLPDSFKDYFLPCNDLYNTDTRACAGSIFVPHVSSKTYGRKSIKRTSILEWNHLNQVLNQNLFKVW